MRVSKKPSPASLCFIILCSIATTPKRKTLSGLLFFLAAFAVHASIDDFKLSDGFVIERVAGPPGVERPMLANFDDRGRLYVADSTGVNLTGAELLNNPPHKIRI